MTAFLFWNLNQKPLIENIKRIVANYDIDILLFTEFGIQPADLLKALNENNPSKFFYSPPIGCQKVTIFTRFSADFIKPISETDRLTIRHLKLPGLMDILLAVIHAPSKLHFQDISQYYEAADTARLIAAAEQTIGHSRTLMVGDFNMNPFEDGLINAMGLHAVMCKKVAGKRSRVVQDKEYAFFYNPMWNLLGDNTPGPPGTYYYSKAEHKVLFWNMFDQVLIRPDLLTIFRNDELRILDSDGTISFLTSDNVPNKNDFSDHLPLFFKLTL